MNLKTLVIFIYILYLFKGISKTENNLLLGCDPPLSTMFCALFSPEQKSYLCWFLAGTIIEREVV